MISFIICSINSEQYYQFQKNITDTCGIPFELLRHDNRAAKWGLCKVYNHYSKIAKYDIICYIHEDVLFHTPNWGQIICDFYKNTPKAGCVGFAGSLIKTKNLSGWATSKSSNRYNFTQGFRDGSSKSYILNPNNEDFAEVVSLDGFCIFCKKEIWDQYKFREDIFTGFHLYDISFSTIIATEFNNYVCNVIKVEHLSPGSFSDDWYKNSKLFHSEMQNILPVISSNFSKDKIQSEENKAAYTFAKQDIKNNWSKRSHFITIKELYKSTNSYRYLLRIIFFTLKYKIKTSRQKK